MNDIVIGSITGYDFDKIKPWVNSLDRSGFTGTKAMLCYNVSYETVEELVKHQLEAPMNVGRIFVRTAAEDLDDRRPDIRTNGGWRFGLIAA